MADIYRQEDFKITKDDIDNIAKENAFDEVNFDRWIAYEQTKLLGDATAQMNAVEHHDIILALQHLQNVYDGKPRISLRFRKDIKEAIEVAHFQAMNEKYANERHKADWESVMLAYDIFYLLRDTQGYLSFNTHNYQRLHFK